MGVGVSVQPPFSFGEQRAKYATLPFVEKPDKIVLSKEELVHLQQKLQMMSVTGLSDFYRAAYHRCRREGYSVPPARALLELIPAWKAKRKS